MGYNPATSPAMRHYRRPLALVSAAIDNSDPTKPRVGVVSLIEIPGGVAVLPWKPTQTLGSPEGERERGTFLGFAGVGVAIDADRTLRDMSASLPIVEYAVDRADRYEHHYELVLTRK